MEYITKNFKNHTVITLTGAIDIYTAPHLKKSIHSLIDSGVQSLVIDMINIKLIDSSGIAMLANIQKRLKNEDGKFYLINVNPDILVILKLASLDKYFPIYQSLEELP